MRILFAAPALLCCGLLFGCAQAQTTAQADAAAVSGDTSPDTKAAAQCTATCGNGTCDPGEAPGSCQDCPGYGSTCIENGCATELASCNAKPACANMLQCLHQCGDTPACAEACKRTGSVGVSVAYAPLVACIVAKNCTKCGNGTCDAGENSGNCATDCKPIDGNGLCEPGESPLTCSADCGMVDPFACSAAKCPEVITACKADPVCGPALTCYSACGTMGCIDACAAKWGSATMQQVSCKSNVCKDSVQPRDVCGNGLCSGSELYSCPTDCPAAPPACGNGVCESGESSKTCVGDCGAATDMFACITQNCASFDAACKADAACVSVVACMKACPLTSGWKKCANSCSPIGKAAWLAVPLFECGDQHGCKPDLPAYCGDSICQPNETAADCQADCYQPAPVCGDGFCDTAESAASCPADCVTCETTGCGKPGLVCCKVSGKPVCTEQAACD